MKNYLPVLVTNCLVAICCIFLTSCNFGLMEALRGHSAARQHSANAAKEDFAIQFSNIDLNASQKELDIFGEQIKDLLKKRDFAGLEAMAVDLKTSKARFAGGGWKIHSFYLWLSGPGVPEPDENDWRRHVGFLKEWASQSPGSALPHISLGQAFIGYAWVVRGDKYANEVPESAWPLVHERLGEAAREAKLASTLEAPDYGYLELLLTLGRVQGWSRTAYDQAYQLAIDHDPTYQYFYTSKATALLPRWNGRPGEWEAYANDVKTRAGENEGLKLYYWIISELSVFPGLDLFNSNVSWQDTKKGFSICLAEYGMSKYRLNQFGKMAIKARDPQTSCHTFANLSGPDDFVPEIWTNKEAFENAKKSARMLCSMPRADNQAK